MALRNLKIFFVLLLTMFGEDDVNGWFRRRRRRRWSPPPPQRCTVSDWTPWSDCSQKCHIGVRTRSRHVVTAESWGGDCPYHLIESDNCGAINGGCQQLCDNANGRCSCHSGYAVSGNNCNDRDECSSSPCSHICRNTIGSFYCECPTGFYLTSNPLICQEYDCGDPAALFNSCPSNTYKDHISSVCAQVTAACPQGTTYNEQCFLSCPLNYTLAKIYARPSKLFGENYTSVDFLSVISSITCQKTQAGQAADVWDVADSELNQYYCRRSNDPPTDLKLNGSVLKEHEAVGTVIGTLRSQDAQPGQTFIYTVQRPSSLLMAQGDKLVNIWDNPRLNGNISLNGGKLSVTVRSTDDGVPPMWLEKVFSITILDVNDPPEQVALSNSVVYENATVGTVIGELTAVDGDDPPNTIPHSNFKWELLEDDGGRFSINVNKITVALSLVGEAQKMHRITVRCSDFGNPVKATTETFIITVVNVNDAPTSLRLIGSTVHELAKVGNVIGQLVVTEKDGDDVSYDISQSDVDTLDKFDIDSTRCQGPGYEYDCKVNVTVKASLDYETKAWYRLNVQANDSHTRAFKQFNIEVINDNELPSAIRLTGSHSVLENSVAGTVVGQFVVTDPDNAKSPSHQTHRCTFNESRPSDAHYFIITAGLVLKVKGAQQINFEQGKNLTFTVTCTDSGRPPLSLSSDFFIIVKDVNEPPVNLTLSSTTVDENSPQGTPVGILSSDDPDGPSDVHTYSIVGPVGVLFSIGGDNNRALLVNGLLDHETNPTLLVIIRVTDKGGLFTQKTFKITVNDVNDPPNDLALPTPFLIENSAERVLISPIVLTDQDGDLPSCTLLDSAGGRVKVVGTNLVVGATVTDYESLPSPQQLNITLNCSDRHGMFIWKSFVINVTNVNEPPSEIQLSAASVRENEAGAIIGQVTVSDPDKGQQHRCTVHDLTVDAASSSERLVLSQHFTVDSSLNLKTLTGLNFEAEHSMDIVINCSDGSLSKTKLFSITVKDVNEIPSGLCDKPIMMGIKTSIGAVIAVMNGKDPDNENAINNDPSNKTVVIKNKQQLSYSLSPEQNSWPFGIKTNSLFKSGEISQPQNITIGVKVKDDGVVVERFSSKGYQYTISKSQSAVFNCTIIVSDQHQSAAILLEPSQVSVTAGNGAVVGVLSTITENVGETFSYELREEAQLPFRVVENKLVVAKKDGLDFQVSSSEEALIAISIISRGSMSNPITESFYVRIVDDRPQAASMCLSPRIVNENQPIDTVIGQLIIDDSSSPLLSCDKQHCCPKNGRHFDYECNINNPEDNEIIPQLQINVTALFRIDDRFRLRTAAKLNYSTFAMSNGSVGIQISCRDTMHPLHFIGETLQLLVSDCDNSGFCPDINECPVCQNSASCQDVIDGYSCQCILGFTGRHCETNINECQGVECQNGGSCQDGIGSFTCNCVGGFSGEFCERQPSLCAQCVEGTLCVTFIKAAIRCLGKQYQIPILVSETQISKQRTMELEEEIGALLDAKITDGNAASARKRRALSRFFYVEILRNNQTISPGQTLLILTALSVSKNYFPLLASEACDLLTNTARSCVENCDILQLVGLPCGNAGPKRNIGAPTEQVSKGLGTGGMAGIAIFVVTFLIAVLVGAIFYYRRKYKVAKQEQGRVSYQAGAEGIDFSNQIYGDNRDWAERLKKDSDDLVRHNLDPTSVIKRNDIKVMENPIYSSSANQVEEFTNPLHGIKAVSLPEDDDIAAAKARNKDEEPYMEPTDGAHGGASNPYYARSPPLRVSLGDSGNKFPTAKARNKDEVPYMEPVDGAHGGALNQRSTSSPPMRVSLGDSGDKLRGNEIARAEDGLETYLKGAKAKVRASNTSQLRKFKRQRSDEKVKSDEERRSLKRGEAPPSFENPFYSNNVIIRDGGNSTENHTYSSISALQNDRPRLPPRPSRRSHEAPPEPLEIREDDTYEALNFGHTEA